MVNKSTGQRVNKFLGIIYNSPTKEDEHESQAWKSKVHFRHIYIVGKALLSPLSVPSQSPLYALGIELGLNNDWVRLLQSSSNNWGVFEENHSFYFYPLDKHCCKDNV